MVEFGTGYHPMDREYEHSDFSHHRRALSPGEEATTGDLGVSIGDIGMSMALGPVPNVPTVASRIRPGVKKVELSFSGVGKGGGQQQTPGMYGEKQRTALREMGMANKVDFTTHSTYGIQGLAGMDQQGNFSRAARDRSLDEIKRAIEFAADVARGGPVVVHTGEFFRPLVDSEWNKGGKWDKKFKMYDDEEGRASFRVVDTRTGGVIEEARKNRKISRPVWNVAMEGEEYFDFDYKKKIAKGDADESGRKIYVDYEGNRLTPDKRIPMFNLQEGKFETKPLGWEELEEEADEMTLRARDEFRKWKKLSFSEQKELEQKSLWVRFLKKDIKEEDILVKPEEAYIISNLETQAANSRGWATWYSGDFGRNVDTIKKLRKAREIYEKIETTVDPEEKWRLKQQARAYSQFVPPETEYPTSLIDKEISDLQRHIKYAQDSSASQWAQAENTMEMIKHVESAEIFGLNEAYEAYAQAGINAMRHSDKLEKKGQLKKPIAVAMENLFPEHYGAHPDELIKLVKNSREKMAQILTQKYDLSKEQAQKEAKEHLTATFDTGHLNMWRKYWVGNPKKSIKENDDDFDKWMLEKVEDMAKAEIIGHVHLVDNYGYNDDHIAPGEGNTPIKQIIKTLKKHNFKGELIVEPGADYTTDTGGFQSMIKTWRHFGSSIYGGAGTVGQRRWEHVGYGYFGQINPPYFVFNPYSPSEDWTLWSGVALE